MKKNNWWLDLNKIFRIHLNINILELCLSFSVEILDIGISFYTNGINWITVNYRLFSKSKKLDEHHYLEWEGFWSPNIKFGFDFHQDVHTDHAGWHYEITILGFMFYITKYDIRHWDYNTNNFKVYS